MAERKLSKPEPRGRFCQMTTQNQLDAVVQELKSKGPGACAPELYEDLARLMPHFNSIWFAGSEHDTIYQYSRAYWGLREDAKNERKVHEWLHLIGCVSAFSKEGVVRSEELEHLLLRRLAGEAVDLGKFDRREITFHEQQLLASDLAAGSWSSNGRYIYEFNLDSPTPKGYELLRSEKKSQEPSHRIVFVAADPTNASRLRLGEEYREISEKIRLSKARDTISLHPAFSTRPADLSQALLDLNPTIVHFSGHGTEMGALCFEDPRGKLLPIPAEALADLFAQFADNLKLVVLNACFSAVQGSAIVKHIECVVGMKESIGDRAAVAYSVGLYQGIGAGRSIVDAHKLGCAQIRLRGLDEHLTPMILLRGGD